MKKSLPVLFLLFTCALFAQVFDPVPEAIEPSGLTFELEDYVTIPISSGQQPKARINLLREVPDGSGRHFVNDLRGKFWVIENGTPELYMNPVVEFENFIQAPGFGTGFGAFAFHPEFANNGKFYTSHAETTGSAPADFSPIADNGISMQWAITEWTATDITANEFDGTRRELLRFDFPSQVHGIQDISFNPNDAPGDEDYGLLYICVGDGGSSINSLPENIQTTASYFGTIFRIDPLGTNSANGKYGIPPTNPFLNDPDALGEIWTYGFRNPHRISWDTEGDHKMLIGDIGEKNIEELNLGLPGANYGWDNREGTFLFDRSLGQNLVFELPPDDSTFNYTYPVAQYDHDEGVAIVAGYVYRGSAFPELFGKYIFGDIRFGRVFILDADELELGSLATITEVHFVDGTGENITLLDLVNGDRADLRFGIDSAGEIYILTKADGKIRTLKTPGSTTATEAITEQVNWLSPNPSDGLFYFSPADFSHKKTDMTVVDAQGRVVWNRHFEASPKNVDLTSLTPGVYWVKWQMDGKAFAQQIHKR